METAAMRDTPATPIDGNSKEAIGAISRAYRDIFTSSNNSCPERPAKRANIPITNNNTYHFSQDATFPQVSSQHIPTQTYQSCPTAPASLCSVAPNNNQHAFHHGDNNQYTYPTNQSHNQSNNATHQKSNSAHESSNIQNQPSCPWKLAPGAKVLVRTFSILHHIKISRRPLKQVLTVLSFGRLAPSTHGLYQELNAQVRISGNPFLNVSLLQSRRWWSLPRAFQDFKSLANKTRLCYSNQAPSR